MTGRGGKQFTHHVAHSSCDGWSAARQQRNDQKRKTCLLHVLSSFPAVQRTAPLPKVFLGSFWCCFLVRYRPIAHVIVVTRSPPSTTGNNDDQGGCCCCCRLRRLYVWAVDYLFLFLLFFFYLTLGLLSCDADDREGPPLQPLPAPGANFYSQNRRKKAININ